MDTIKSQKDFFFNIKVTLYEIQWPLSSNATFYSLTYTVIILSLTESLDKIIF